MLDAVDILYMDVFFFMTAVSILVVTVLLIIVFIYTIRILRDVKKITKRARRGADMFAGEIEDVRDDIKKSVREVKDYVVRVVKKPARRARRTAKKNNRKQDEAKEVTS